MKRAAFFLVFLQFAMCWAFAGAEVLRGVVRNGTTRKVSAGDEVTLLQAGNGMQEVAKTTTNAKGGFSFQAPRAQLPYVISVKHQDVNYTGVATPGGPVVKVLVFDAAAHVERINIEQRMMVLQSDGDKLKVNERYTVANESAPPRTMTGQRTLVIYVPEGAAIQEAGARPRGLMTLKTAVVPLEERNRYAFTYPIRPGESEFTITYTLPYSGKLRIEPKIVGPIASVMLVAPDSMELVPADASILTRASDRQIKNVTVFVAADVSEHDNLGFEVQGSGTLARSQKEKAGQAAATPRRSPAVEPNRSAEGANAPTAAPAAHWVFLAVLFLFLAAGATYAYAVSHAAPRASAPRPEPAPAPMAAMKEEMFQLEADRLQGKISLEEYEAAKAALDRAVLHAVERAGHS